MSDNVVTKSDMATSRKRKQPPRDKLDVRFRPEQLDWVRAESSAANLKPSSWVKDVLFGVRKPAKPAPISIGQAA